MKVERYTTSNNRHGFEIRNDRKDVIWSGRDFQYEASCDDAVEVALRELVGERPRTPSPRHVSGECLSRIAHYVEQRYGKVAAS